MVLLRDGRTLIGYLRSVDQFANLVLHKTIERIHVGKEYGDIPRGIFIIRGENVVLLGEIVCSHSITSKYEIYTKLIPNLFYIYRTAKRRTICRYKKFQSMIFWIPSVENTSNDTKNIV